jgi:hypothetical protein
MSEELKLTHKNRLVFPTSEELSDYVFKGNNEAARMLNKVVFDAMKKAAKKVFPATKAQFEDKAWNKQRYTKDLNTNDKVGVYTGKTKDNYIKEVLDSVKNNIKVTKKTISVEYSYDVSKSINFLTRQNKKLSIPNRVLYSWIWAKLVGSREYLDMKRRHRKRKNFDSWYVRDTSWRIKRTWEEHYKPQVAYKKAFDIMQNQTARQIYLKHLENNMPKAVDAIKRTYILALKDKIKNGR